MNFSELVADWENGWRGIAIDEEGNEYDFEKNYFMDVEVGIGEKWTKKEAEPEQAVYNITVNISSDADIDKFISELSKYLGKNSHLCSY